MVNRQLPNEAKPAHEFPRSHPIEVASWELTGSDSGNNLPWKSTLVHRQVHHYHSTAKYMTALSVSCVPCADLL